MIRPDTIPCPLRLLAERHPEGIFLSDPGRDISFAQADERVCEFQGIISSAEMLFCASMEGSAGDVVIQIVACLREGVPIILQNQRLPPQVLEHQSDWVRNACRNLKVSPPVPGHWAYHSPSTILFTSGSSGEPKGIVHSVENHWSSARAAVQQVTLQPGDRWLCPLPLYHVGGLSILFRCLATGATMCCPSHGNTVSQAVNEMNPTHLSLVPTQLYRWLMDPEFRLGSVKRVLIGGAALPDEVRKKAEGMGVPIATSYGMTETASQVTATPPGEAASGSGRPLPHAEFQIAEENEILVRGPSVAMGRLMDQGVSSVTDQDGWLRTGDVGRLEEGILYVDGRRDHQFISGGENIQPEAIEQALLGIEGISEAFVVPKQDPEFGHRPLAWVDAEMGPQHMEDWNRELRKALPGFMIPVEYRSLPEAHGLKRNRKELRG